MIYLNRELTLRGIHAFAIAGVIFALLVGLAVQTARIEGFKIWPVAIEGWKPKASRLEQALANVRVAEQLAESWARQARLDKEARYRAVAQRTDIDAKRETSVALGDAERFIAGGGHFRAGASAGAGGLRAQADRGEGGPAGTGPGDHRPGDPEGAGEAAQLDEAEGQLIGVTADDVRICTINTVKAEAARDWALALEEASEPAEQADLAAPDQ